MLYHLAQFNIAKLKHPLEAPENSEFAAALEPINAIAEATPGFVWRLTDDDGGSSSYVSLPEIDDPLLIVNYSIWTDVDSLKHFVNRSGHASYLRRRTDWFELAEAASTVCWYIDAGTIPDVSDGYRRLLHLQDNGPSTEGWPLNKPIAKPGNPQRPSPS